MTETVLEVRCPVHQRVVTWTEEGRCLYGACGCRFQRDLLVPPVRRPLPPARPRLLPRVRTVLDPVTGLRRLIVRREQDG